jgi:energy-coupling factor transporter ATP-binding protein EcfA2
MSNDFLPDFKIDASKIPEVKIKSIRFQNFKAFDDATFDFMDSGKCSNFVCFYGPNGCGKTSVLETITLIFSRLEGREEAHLKALLGKSVRHIKGNQSAIYNDEDFLITANIHSSLGDYEIQINKKGFIKDHPPEIKELVYRLCYYARFDQELSQFQLNRQQWSIFKDLFESVTGFEIEEQVGVFNESSDPVQAEILRKYVLGFWVHKPDETISHKECSAGERKIIKSFSTLLNKEYMPSVVCIDNAEMHVESGRHIDLIESIKRCFPTSQIFVSTHSYQISKNFGNKKQLYDLRLLKASSLIKEEPWRLYIADEIKDGISKLKSITTNKEIVDGLIMDGNSIIEECFRETNASCIIEKTEKFLEKVTGLYVGDLVSYYSEKKIKV